MANNPAFKGWFGEFIMFLAKKIALNGDIYIDINNVTLRTSSGTTQIDHIIVSKYGIFVIETKNMEGLIFGEEKESIWTQSFNKAKFHFQNPLHQNYRHTRALEELLDLPFGKFHSVVCFISQKCKIKTKVPSNVTTGSPFGYIKSKNKIILSDVDVKEIVVRIKKLMLPKNMIGLSSADTRKEHLDSLKDQHVETTECPWCGGELVTRFVKSGLRAGINFTGCENFPECRYTKK